jgi:DNA-binding GntR family transcriptional regulator
MNEQGLLDNFRAVNLVDQIANFLEQAILDGSIQMGVQLIENDIARRFSTSRQPIREAFRVLEKRGLVTIVPRKGTFVTTITEKDFEQFFPVVAVLDGLAGRFAYRHIEENGLCELESALQRMSHNAELEDTKKYLVSHADFHVVLNKISRNDLLIDTLSSIRIAHSWFIMTHMQYSEEQYKKSIDYHRMIIEELRRKKIGEEGMEKLLREHVLVSEELYRTHVQAGTE